MISTLITPIRFAYDKVANRAVAILPGDVYQVAYDFRVSGNTLQYKTSDGLGGFVSRTITIGSEGSDIEISGTEVSISPSTPSDPQSGALHKYDRAVSDLTDHVDTDGSTPITSAKKGSWFQWNGTKWVLKYRELSKAVELEEFPNSLGPVNSLLYSKGTALGFIDPVTFFNQNISKINFSIDAGNITSGTLYSERFGDDSIVASKLNIEGSPSDETIIGYNPISRNLKWVDQISGNIPPNSITSGQLKADTDAQKTAMRLRLGAGLTGRVIVDYTGRGPNYPVDLDNNWDKHVVEVRMGATDSVVIRTGIGLNKYGYDGFRCKFVLAEGPRSLNVQGTTITTENAYIDVYRISDSFYYFPGNNPSGLVDGSVTHPKLAVDAVETENIKDQNITLPKIADGSISPIKMQVSTDAQKTAMRLALGVGLTDIVSLNYSGNGLGYIVNLSNTWDKKIVNVSMTSTDSITIRTISGITKKGFNGFYCRIYLLTGGSINIQSNVISSKNSYVDVYRIGDVISCFVGNQNSYTPADGSITESQLADNSVSLAKMKKGTPDKWLKYDSDGSLEETDPPSGGGGSFIPTKDNLYSAVKDILVPGINTSLTETDSTKTIAVNSSGSGGGGGGNFIPTKDNLYSVVKDIFVPGTNTTLTETDSTKTIAVNSSGGSGGSPFVPSKTNLYSVVKDIFVPGTNTTLTENDSNSTIAVNNPSGGSNRVNYEYETLFFNSSGLLSSEVGTNFSLNFKNGIDGPRWTWDDFDLISVWASSGSPLSSKDGNMKVVPRAFWLRANGLFFDVPTKIGTLRIYRIGDSTGKVSGTGTTDNVLNLVRRPRLIEVTGIKVTAMGGGGGTPSDDSITLDMLAHGTPDKRIGYNNLGAPSVFDPSIITSDVLPTGKTGDVVSIENTLLPKNLLFLRNADEIYKGSIETGRLYKVSSLSSSIRNICAHFKIVTEDSFKYNKFMSTYVILSDGRLGKLSSDFETVTSIGNVNMGLTDWEPQKLIDPSKLDSSINSDLSNDYNPSFMYVFAKRRVAQSGQPNNRLYTVNLTTGVATALTSASDFGLNISLGKQLEIVDVCESGFGYSKDSNNNITDYTETFYILLKLTDSNEVNLHKLDIKLNTDNTFSSFTLTQVGSTDDFGLGVTVKAGGIYHYNQILYLIENTTRKLYTINKNTSVASAVDSNLINYGLSTDVSKMQAMTLNGIPGSRVEAGLYYNNGGWIRLDNQNSNLKNNSVKTPTLSPLSVTTAKIDDKNVTDAKIDTVDSYKVTNWPMGQRTTGYWGSRGGSQSDTSVLNTSYIFLDATKARLNVNNDLSHADVKYVRFANISSDSSFAGPDGPSFLSFFKRIRKGGKLRLHEDNFNKTSDFFSYTIDADPQFFDTFTDIKVVVNTDDSYSGALNQGDDLAVSISGMNYEVRAENVDGEIETDQIKNKSVTIPKLSDAAASNLSFLGLSGYKYFPQNSTNNLRNNAGSIFRINLNQLQIVPKAGDESKLDATAFTPGHVIEVKKDNSNYCQYFVESVGTVSGRKYFNFPQNYGRFCVGNIEIDDTAVSINGGSAHISQSQIKSTPTDNIFNVVSTKLFNSIYPCSSVLTHPSADGDYHLRVTKSGSNFTCTWKNEAPVVDTIFSRSTSLTITGNAGTFSSTLNLSSNKSFSGHKTIFCIFDNIYQGMIPGPIFDSFGNIDSADTTYTWNADPGIRIMGAYGVVCMLCKISATSFKVASLSQ